MCVSIARTAAGLISTDKPQLAVFAPWVLPRHACSGAVQLPVAMAALFRSVRKNSETNLSFGFGVQLLSPHRTPDTLITSPGYFSPYQHSHPKRPVCCRSWCKCKFTVVITSCFWFGLQHIIKSGFFFEYG